MKRGLVALALWLAVPLTANAAVVRSLFVGVDHYRFSRAHLDTARFDDLKGAVNDVARIKSALQAAYDLDIGPAPDGRCPPNTEAASITLVDACATHDAILAALTDRIARSRPGDTVLFYFAGHGSKYPDDTVQDQASGFNSTIMPSDARDPAAAADGDILDRDLRGLRERAMAAGVDFVTIFDSCNSGTATRDGADGVSRGAPRLDVAPKRKSPPAAAAGPGGGGWVHLGAAEDGEQAQETTFDTKTGARGGVYTTALVETLQVMPHAALGDLAREAAIRVSELGAASQHPHAEGTGLDATLGGKAGGGVMLEATLQGRVATLQAGSLSGVTMGSAYDIFAKRADAAGSGARPLGHGVVTGLDLRTAQLTLDDPPTRPAARVVARETEHAFGTETLSVADRVTNAADRARVEAALRALAFVKPGDPAEISVAMSPTQAGVAILRARDGTIARVVGAVSDPQFSRNLEADLKAVAHVQALLALRTPFKPLEVGFCLEARPYEPGGACPAPQKAGRREIPVSQFAKLTVVNNTERALYIYAPGVDPNYKVAAVLPPPGAVDPQVAPGAALTGSNRFRLSPAGSYRFVVLATDEPIKVEALKQTGFEARDAEACKTALERILCAARDGRRDPAAPRVGNWSAAIYDIAATGEGERP